MAGQDAPFDEWFGALLRENPMLERLTEKSIRRIKNGRYTQSGETDFTALHYAAKLKLPHAVDQLLKKFGMNPNAKTSSGTTPLGLAVRFGWAHPDTTSTVMHLVEGGADVNDVSGEQTPLVLALNRGNSEVIDYLLEHGVDVNARDRWERTPIFYATDASQIEKLAARGADMNAVDRWGETAIFNAITAFGRGSLVLIKKLVEVGLDWSIVNSQGQTAEAYAESRGLPRVVGYLAQLRTDKQVRERGQRATEVRGASEIALEKGLPPNVLKNVNEFVVGSPVELPAASIGIRAQAAENMRRERIAKREAEEEGASAEAVAAMKGGRKTRVRKTRRRKTLRRK